MSKRSDRGATSAPDDTQSPPRKKGGCLRPLLIALALIVAIGIAAKACGGGGGNASKPATSAAQTSSAPIVSSSTQRLVCTGGPVTGVTIVRSGDDATINWQGKWTPSKEFNGFYVNAYGASDTSRQLGKKIYADGSSPEQFIFDFGSAHQQNVATDGRTIESLKFPGAFAGMGANVKLDGAVTADGADREKCTAA